MEQAKKISNYKTIDKDNEKEKPKVKFEKLKYVITGILAGVANGLFGGGGGMIVVPMLVYVLKTQPKRAHATAIFLILPLCITSGIFYAVFGAFKLSMGLPTLIGVVLGGIVGALLLSKLSSKWIMVIFAVVMAVAGGKMLFF